MSQTRFCALIVAAGVGSRMQADKPKQYLPLLDKSVLEYSVQALLKNPKLTQITLVISPNDCHFAHSPLANNPHIQTVAGGVERQHSVLNGLYALRAQQQADDYVLIHDGARPCLQQKELNALLDNANPEGAILAVKATDSIKQSSLTLPSQIDQSLPRAQIWQAQTPQLFPLGRLIYALEQCQKQQLSVTDEAEAMAHLGHHPKLISAVASNIKITHPQDLALAEFYLQQEQP